MKLIKSIDDSIGMIEHYGAGFCMMFAVLFIGVNVFTRYILGFTYFWLLEIVRYLVVWSTFFGAAYLARTAGHISIDLLVVRLPKRARISVDIGACVIGFLFCLYLTLKGTGILAHSIHMGERSATALRIPMFIPKSAVPVGAVMLCIEFLRRIASDIKFFVSEKEPWWMAKVG